MTACRASCALLLFLTLGAAQGQTPPVATGAPIPLGSAATTAPSAPENTPAEYKPGMLRPSAQPGVTAGELGTMDGPPVGLLDESSGGLGQSMWVNSSRTEIEDLLTRLPLVSADPFARALARRVVLTTSDAPVGDGKRALITIRIEKLIQAGLINEAGALAASLQLNNDPDFARVQADALLYAGRDKDVCSDLTAARLTAPEPFWLQLRVWCFLSTGDTASAELARAALEVTGKDPAFDQLVADVLDGKKKAPTIIDHPTALHIYLMRKAGLPITNGIAAKLGTAANLMAARETRNTAADRLSAAARISATGALSPVETVAILNGQAYPADQLANPQAVIARLTFLPTQALLRRASTLETRPPQKVDLLLAALSPDGKTARLPQTAALQGDIASNVKPDGSTMKGRFLISRALILNGKADTAAAWYANAEADMDHAAFAILLDIAAPNPARDGGAQAAYDWLAKNAAPQQNPVPIAALALGLADVLGKPMPPNAKALAGTLEGMRWDGARPGPDELRKLVEASSQPGRKGEVVLRILDMVGAGGPSDLPPDVAVECVRILQQMGMTGEARALAIETLAVKRAP
ncbi:MAG: hypothetical protein ISS15_12940 [Alphaproteobacteria bacterium]|nr:hypothetical protein [Alphaproteobacteria bacterium]MBL7098557.1 hypothetical protein [Alphaproteobacteria bacterium]